jgi:hypothetical protein
LSQVDFGEQADRLSHEQPQPQEKEPFFEVAACQLRQNLYPIKKALSAMIVQTISDWIISDLELQLGCPNWMGKKNARRIGRDTLQLTYENICRNVGVKADCPPVDLQHASVAVFGADNVGLDAGVHPHRCHACTDLSISGNPADLDSA